MFQILYNQVIILFFCFINIVELIVEILFRFLQYSSTFGLTLHFLHLSHLKDPTILKTQIISITQIIPIIIPMGSDN